MHWSGNNNQIYKSLTELFDKGLVTNVVKHQESSPTKKIYSITSEGLVALKEWVLSPAEPSEIKSLSWFSLHGPRNSIPVNQICCLMDMKIKLRCSY
ncbi:PadR family transcriptional regulator [Desulforamulus aquiferis]|uniref:PadR family transcriptional regulator n=1 Tax=Desulforamulus aquiferis TaxID=1397668 RepID=A0AAW7ZFN2_9FIRM|nr:PadR family transcriptional regulator [Desulforamulus aquiferis]MDO7788285.1 PadR family transcriptional regulator [Desulforamulus aquiferis]